jgi:shikimate kinase
MGVGKTSNGRKLAKRLGIRFADMDMIIEEQEGMSIEEIFRVKGEDCFRAKEKEVLHQLGKVKEDMVISTGGGVPCFNDNMDFINSTGFSIYLKMSPVALLNRLTKSAKPARPLLNGKSEGELLEYINTKLCERELFYLQSKQVVQAENLKPQDLEALLPL